MSKPLSLICLVLGVVLIFYGISASESFASDFSEFFSGTPTDESMWFLIGGIVLAVLGLFGTARSSRSIV